MQGRRDVKEAELALTVKQCVTVKNEYEQYEYLGAWNKPGHCRLRKDSYGVLK